VVAIQLVNFVNKNFVQRMWITVPRRSTATWVLIYICNPV